MSAIRLSFTDWVYPTKHPRRQVSAWSRSGLFAQAVGEVLTIFGGDGKTLQPMISWRPFEHAISAIAWYDGSMCPEKSVPVIVIASRSGRIYVYDLCAKKSIACFKIPREYASAIQWSPFSTSTFYVGTCGGELLCFEIVLDRLVTFTQKWTLKVGFPVDFIAIEPNYGNSLAVASGSGNIAFVRKLSSGKPEMSGDSLAMVSQAKSTIMQMEYLRSYPDFLVVVTKLGTLLYSIRDEVSITLLADQNLMALYQLSFSGKLMIGVKEDSVHLYEFGKETVKLQDLYLASHSTASTKLHGQKEIIASHFVNDKILLLTTGWVLLTVEVKRRRMFLTGYMKLLGAKPLDWSLWRGSMAIVTETGQLLVTRVTQLTRLFSTPARQKRKKGTGKCETARPVTKPPSDEELAECIHEHEERESISRPSSPTRRLTRRLARSLKLVSTPDWPTKRSRVLSVDDMSIRPMLPGLGDVLDPIPEDAQLSTQSITSPPKMSATPPRHNVACPCPKPEIPIPRLNLGCIEAPIVRQRRNSAAEKRFDDEDINSVINVINEGKVREAPEEATKPEKSKSLAEYGNSRSFLWAFQVALGPLQHVEWISTSRILVWGTETVDDVCRNYAYVIDCRNRRQISLINKQIDALNLPLTSLIVSDNKRLVCLTLNERLATIMTLLPEIKTIGSFPFGSKVVSAFSPASDRLVFLDHKGRMRFTAPIDPRRPGPVRIEMAKRLDMKKDLPTCILWKGTKDLVSTVMVGMDSGSILKINSSNWTITTVTPMKNSIATMIKCGKGVIVVDNKGNAGTVGLSIDIHFPEVVKNIKSISGTTFVVRGGGEGRIRVIQNAGKYVPFYAPNSARCHIMKTREAWSRAVQELEITGIDAAIEYSSQFGMNLIRLILESVRYQKAKLEQLTVLRDVIQRQAKLQDLAMRLSLVIGDRQRAHELCLNTVNDQKCDAVVSIIKSTLFGSPPKKEFLRSATKQLVAKGEIEHALDLFMIAGEWKSVLKLLWSRHEFKRLVAVISALPVIIDERFVVRLAKQFAKPHPVGIGLTMLGTTKSLGEVSSLFETINEVEQAKFVSLCSNIE